MWRELHLNYPSLCTQKNQPSTTQVWTEVRDATRNAPHHPKTLLQSIGVWSVVGYSLLNPRPSLFARQHVGQGRGRECDGSHCVEVQQLPGNFH